MKNKYLKSAIYGDIEGMIKAKAKGFEIQEVNEWGANAYLIGARNGLHDIMEQAKNDGVDVNKTDNLGWNAYLHGVFQNSSETMEIAKNHGVNIHHRNAWRENALDIALKFDNTDALATFQKHKREIKIR